jgi:hypothetical protein
LPLEYIYYSINMWIYYVRDTLIKYFFPWYFIPVFLNRPSIQEHSTRETSWRQISANGDLDSIHTEMDEFDDWTMIERESSYEDGDYEMGLSDEDDDCEDLYASGILILGEWKNVDNKKENSEILAEKLNRPNRFMIWSQTSNGSLEYM